ncbi:MAG: cation:proton antiporter subunit C [Candidatus Thermoplasmatota archaeon]|nr:cation:proton antiporter subunit C [Candidatus Thermoplasmatota archaeon]
MIESITGGYLTSEVAGIILVLIGLYGLMTKSNLVKQVLAINVISTGVVLYFTKLGYVEGGTAPLIPSEVMVDPLPATLMLTALVIDVAITSFALALIMRMEGSP